MQEILVEGRLCEVSFPSPAALGLQEQVGLGNRLGFVVVVDFWQLGGLNLQYACIWECKSKRGFMDP